jgi:Domain of unknown function (DUF4377)
MYNYIILNILGGFLFLANCGTPVAPPNNIQPNTLQPVAQRGQLTFLVDHYAMPCTGEGMQCCLRIKRSANQAEWELFYDNIEGFTPVWGQSYTLIVNETPVENPAQDASSKRYRLERIEKTTPAPADVTFQLPLIWEGSPLVTLRDKQPVFFDQISIDCPAAQQADLLKAQTGTFRHGSNGRIVWVN